MEEKQPMSGCVFGYDTEQEALAVAQAEIDSDIAIWGVVLESLFASEYEPGTWQAEWGYVFEDVAAQNIYPSDIEVGDPSGGALLLLALAVGALFFL